MKSRPFLLFPLAAVLPWLAVANTHAQTPATGSLDPSFATDGVFTVFPPDSAIQKYILVEAVAVQPDGKILAGGQFDTYDGVSRSGILRFNADGSLDAGFDPGTGVSSGNPDLFANVDGIAVQPDGKVLISGYFDHVNGQATYSLARLEADGSLDASFVPVAAAANGATAVLQPDGKILIATSSNQYLSADTLSRLNPDGTTDNTFTPIAGGQGCSVGTVAVQADGKILVSGDFGDLFGPRRRFLVRLNPDGSLDTGFRLKGNAFDSRTAGISIIVPRADGEILVGGNFTRLNRVPRAGLALLDANGKLDPGFDPGAGAAVNPPSAGIASLAVQPDGKIIVAGSFRHADGLKRHRIARLNADGSLDPGFNPRQGANASVFSVALQPDGKIVIGGYFTEYGGVSVPEIARLQ